MISFVSFTVSQRVENNLSFTLSGRIHSFFFSPKLGLDLGPGVCMLGKCHSIEGHLLFRLN